MSCRGQAPGRACEQCLGCSGQRWHRCTPSLDTLLVTRVLQALQLVPGSGLTNQLIPRQGHPYLALHQPLHRCSLSPGCPPLRPAHQPPSQTLSTTHGLPMTQGGRLDSRSLLGTFTASPVQNCSPLLSCPRPWVISPSGGHRPHAARAERPSDRTLPTAAGMTPTELEGGSPPGVRGPEGSAR